MILRFKVSKRSSVKQWEICCYVKDKAEGDISWLCSILVVESVGFVFAFLGGGKGGLGRICLGSVKEPTDRSYFK